MKKLNYDHFPPSVSNAFIVYISVGIIEQRGNQKMARTKNVYLTSDEIYDEWK